MTPCAWCGGPFKKIRGQKYDRPECREAAGLARALANPGPLCSVEDCPRTAIARTWCLMHYKRWRNTGDPTVLKHHRGWTVDEMGYRRRLIDGRMTYEHRYVMEIHLGRPLGRREQVHHIDGDRTNNALENLVVMMLGDHQRFHGRKKADALGKSHRGPKPTEDWSVKADRIGAANKKSMGAQTTKEEQWKSSQPKPASPPTK